MSDSRRRYEGVLRAVEHNTGGSQPPAMREAVLLGNRSRAGYDPDRVRSAIRAAESNGDLLRFEDAEGRARLARTTTETLLELARWAADRDQPNQQVVALANRARV